MNLTPLLTHHPAVRHMRVISVLFGLALVQLIGSNPLRATNAPCEEGYITINQPVVTGNADAKVIGNAESGYFIIYPVKSAGSDTAFNVSIIASLNAAMNEEEQNKVSAIMVDATGITMAPTAPKGSKGTMTVDLSVASSSAKGVMAITYKGTASTEACCKVNLLPVEVRDISNNKVITDIAWIKGHKTDGSGEEPEMPKLEARIPGLPNTVQVLWNLESLYPRRNARDDINVPYIGGNDPGVFTVGDQPWKIWEDINFSTDPIFGGNEKLKFKLIGESGPLGEGVIEFKIRGENPDDARCKAHIIANQGSIWYAWAIAKHESGDSKGEYNQFANGLDNGGAGAHGAKGEPFYAPSEGDGWGLFQRDSASGVAVTTKETWSWDGNMRGFLNDEYPEQIRIANNYVESVRRNNPATFVEPQFTIKGLAISGRHVLTLTWYNGPQGRSNSRLMHFNGSTWSLDLPNAPEKDQPYVHEIMDTYNGQ